jgi:TPR repeat protein
MGRPLIHSFAELRDLGSGALAEVLTGPDAAEAIELAARAGVHAAQLRLGRHLLDQGRQATALGWFMTAARDGDAEAMNMVGRCHEQGWGTPIDYAAAAHWYRKAALRGHDWAQYNLGHLYLDGRGVFPDRGLAYGWYRRSAAQGHARAMNLVARCLEEGWGIPRDPKAAAEWYRRSAEAGYFRGQYNHATILARAGRDEEAAEWFRKAAEGGTEAVRRAVEGWAAVTPIAEASAPR